MFKYIIEIQIFWISYWFPYWWWVGILQGHVSGKFNGVSSKVLSIGDNRSVGIFVFYYIGHRHRMFPLVGEWG